VKFGGIATHQARRAATAIARLAGADARDPGEAVLAGRLLVGDRSRRLTSREDVDRRPLWWPPGKVVGEYLPPWLEAYGALPATRPAPGRGIPVRRPLSTLRGPEAQYLYDLARQFRPVR
jgi:sulfide:quinone oxidoreductase